MAKNKLNRSKLHQILREVVELEYKHSFCDVQNYEYIEELADNESDLLFEDIKRPRKLKKEALERR